MRMDHPLVANLHCAAVNSAFTHDSTTFLCFMLDFANRFVPRGCMRAASTLHPSILAAREHQQWLQRAPLGANSKRGTLHTAHAPAGRRLQSAHTRGLVGSC